LLSFDPGGVRQALPRRAGKVTGTGFYITSAPVNDDQQLILDLEVDGVALSRMDSGVVPGGLAYPRIDLSALTSEPCYQSGVGLVAAPAYR